jgi:glutathione synthase/RimK-type ligase-like ATP-grasp enzyme
MNPEVLILAGIYDFSADLVCLRLHENGVTYLRLNRESLSENMLTLDPFAASLRVEGPAGKMLVGPGLRSIWFRQPVFLRNTPPQPLSVDEQLERSQWPAFLRALSVFDRVAWMNHPQKTYLAESKPYQLMAARKCGFRVPETRITNDGSSIEKDIIGPLVIKSLDTVLLREGDDSLFTYTTLTDGVTLSVQDLRAAPVLIQEEVQVKADIRVTVVGDEIFAVKIASRSGLIRGDWRLVPRDDLVYEDISLGTDTIRSCIQLSRLLQLSFAAIDLMDTDDGTYFVEVNPTGEWGWITNTERPIDCAIAKWLAKEAI